MPVSIHSSKSDIHMNGRNVCRQFRCGCRINLTWHRFVQRHVRWWRRVFAQYAQYKIVVLHAIWCGSGVARTCRVLGPFGAFAWRSTPLPQHEGRLPVCKRKARKLTHPQPRKATDANVKNLKIIYRWGKKRRRLISWLRRRDALVLESPFPLNVLLPLR